MITDSSTIILLTVCSILSTSLLPTIARAECELVFYNLNTTEIIVIVNTSVTLMFTLTFEDCGRRYNYRVYIYRMTAPFCALRIDNGTCTDYSYLKSCSCGNKYVPFKFSKRMDKEDSGTWRWVVFNDSLQNIASAWINFTIISPSRIISLTVAGRKEPLISLIEKDFLINCSWINGDPPSTAKLLLNNYQLNVSQTSGDISYQLLASPELNGAVVRCDADGSVRNMSTVLFISENRPVFFNSTVKSFYVGQGKTYNFTFSLRILDPEQLHCNLYMTKSFGVDIKLLSMNEYNCSVLWSADDTHDSQVFKENSKTEVPDTLQGKCVCYFSGSQPNLSLTVTIQIDVTEQDSGNWRMTVSNRDGTDYQDFFLFVTKDKCECISCTTFQGSCVNDSTSAVDWNTHYNVSPSPTENKEPGEEFNLVNNLVFGAVVAIVICCSFAFILHIKKYRQKILKSAERSMNRSMQSVESKCQDHEITHIDLNNLLPIHKLDNSRDSGFLDINSLTVQE